MSPERPQDFFAGLRRGLGFGCGLLLTLFIGALIASPPNSFAPGDLVSSSQINANFVDLDTRATSAETRLSAIESNLLAPVGSIVGWHKNIGGAGTIPAGWLECNGQTVLDANSPLNGTALPDLNGGTYFLRGAATSGAFQSDSFRSHNHSFFTSQNMGPGHNPITGYCGLHATDRINGCGAWSGEGGTWVNNGLLGEIIQSTGGGETRPLNMSVVWIMRIK